MHQHKTKNAYNLVYIKLFACIVCKKSVKIIQCTFQKPIDLAILFVYNRNVINQNTEEKEVQHMPDVKLSVDEIYNQLVDEICYLEYLPGDSMSEHLLCERFGISRTPIRAVLQRLAFTGHVQIHSKKGTIITPIDFDIVSQMIYQRIAVETKILIDFIKIGDAYDIEAVNHLILESIKVKESMDVSPSNQQMMQFYDIDNRMHKVWYASTHKLYLWDAFVRQNAHYCRFKALDMKNKHNYEELISEHETLFHMIRNKDLSGVEDAVAAHFNGGVKRLGNRIFTDLSYLFVTKD